MSRTDDRLILLSSYAELRGCAVAYRHLSEARLSGTPAGEVAEVALAWARALAAYGLDVRRGLERRHAGEVDVSSTEWLGALHSVVVLHQIGASFVLLAEDELVRSALLAPPQLDVALGQLGTWRALIEEWTARVPDPPFTPDLSAVVPVLAGGRTGPRRVTTDRSFDTETTGVLAVSAATLMYYSDLCALLAVRRVAGEDTVDIAFATRALTGAGDLAVLQSWLRARPVYHSLGDVGVRAGLVDWQLGELTATLVALSDPTPDRSDGLILAPERLLARLGTDTAQALGRLVADDPGFLISGARRIWDLRAAGTPESELFDRSLASCRAHLSRSGAAG